MSMNMHNAALILDETLTTVRCLFRGGSNDYLFACRKDLAATLLVDDLVIADTSKGVQIVQVVSVDDDNEIDSNSTINYNFIFQRVDMRQLVALQSAHEQSMNNLRKMQRDRMRQEVRQSIRDSLLTHSEETVSE